MSQSAVDAMPGTALAPQRAGSGRLRATVARSLGAVEALWREAEARLVCTPYQRFGFCAAHAETVGAAAGLEVAVVVASRADGAPAFILPLQVRRYGPLRMAGPIGGRHANFAVPVFDPAAFPEDRVTGIGQAIRQAARRAGIDLVLLPHVPATWAGHANPLAGLPHQRSPNAAPRATLQLDAAATLDRLRGTSGLKRLRGKERKLAELGPVRHLVARDAADKARVLDAFFRQKAAWFARQGIPDPFAAPAAATFLRRLVSSPDGLLELHALEAGGTVVATFGGGLHQGRFAAALNSYDLGEASRHSPGEILLREVTADLARRGVATLDLGVGDGEYKRLWLPDEDALADVVLGCSALGVLLAPCVAGATWAKRAVKADRRLAAWARRLRGERVAQRRLGD